MKAKPKTKPQVFIIESLNFDDEAEELYKGKAISQMLALSGKECLYVYIRTRAELEAVLEQFWDSRYRYLHLSASVLSRQFDRDGNYAR